MLIETQNLTLSQFTTNDAAFIQVLVNTPAWLQNIGDRNIKTLDDARNYLVNGPMHSYEKEGFGLMLIKLKASNMPIGMCGLIKRDTLQHVDIGFALLPEYEGQGYAYEASAATLAFAKENLELERVVAITIPENIRSIRLLDRLGMHFEKMIQMPGGDKELMLLGKTL